MNPYEQQGQQLEAQRVELLALLADARTRIEQLEAAIEHVVAFRNEVSPIEWQRWDNAVVRLGTVLEEGNGVTAKTTSQGT